MVIEDCTCLLLDLYGDVFQYDWDSGIDYEINTTYSPANLSYITDKHHMKVVLPDPHPIPGAYVTKKVTFKDVEVAEGHTSPDGALDAFLSVLSSVKSSLQVQQCNLIM